MTTPDTAGLPCPFCGHIGVNVHEASTFRWVVAECDGCGAQGPEARRDTTKSWPNEAEDTPKAIAEWNTRAAQAAQPTAPMSGNVAPVCPESSKLIAERKPLSDAEIDAVTDAQWGKGCELNQYLAHRAYARAIEAAIRQGGNHG